MKIIIKPHSFIDVITNSSTEIFIANRGHTLNEVEEIVEKLKSLFHYTYYEPITVEEVNDEWSKEYYGEGAILIEADQYSIHPDFADLLKSVFDTGERNEDAYN